MSAATQTTHFIKSHIKIITHLFSAYQQIRWVNILTVLSFPLWFYHDWLNKKLQVHCLWWNNWITFSSLFTFNISPSFCCCCKASFSDLGLDSSEVTLHGAEAALQGHDTSKVVTQLVCRLDQLGLLVDPALWTTNNSTDRPNKTSIG